MSPKMHLNINQKKNKKIINEPKNAIEYKPEVNVLPALQYNPTNNNSDYINPIPSTSGTQNILMLSKTICIMTNSQREKDQSN